MKKTSKNRSRKVVKSKTIHKLWVLPFVVGVASLVLGLAVGVYSTQKHASDPRYELASRSEISTAKASITSLFKAQSSTQCTDETDPISPQDREKVFDDYLKVNKYANRAVIRGCSDTDSLLAKNPINGKWEEAAANISLDTRANPAWQRECLIDDITKADEIVRPENGTIDTSNFIDCRVLLEREQIYTILVLSGTYKSSEITQKDIDHYIKSAEDFMSY